MKHFTTEEWIDFVNQVVSPSALDEMENHPGNFGRIISTSNNPRILQFALKFNF